MSTLSLPSDAKPRSTPIHWLGKAVLRPVEAVGSVAVFTWQLLGWLFSQWPRPAVIWPNLYQIGVMSLPVVLVTGGFIGMVLAVQTYDQLRAMGLESRLGSVINVTLVKELGPVLAAVMLAGRVGCRIAAEIGTMRVTEQLDALKALGANPIQYLVVPRFLGCVLLIPLLCVMADGVGMISGWWFSTNILHIESFYFWHYTTVFITAYDFLTGILKSLCFGAAIAIIACHRGFHSGAGAEGVGRAATETFVYSFVVILFLDLILAVLFAQTYLLLWGEPTLAL